MLTAATTQKNSGSVCIGEVLAGVALLAESFADLGSFHLVACPSLKPMEPPDAPPSSGWSMNVKKVWGRAEEE